MVALHRSRRAAAVMAAATAVLLGSAAPAQRRAGARGAQDERADRSRSASATPRRTSAGSSTGTGRAALQSAYEVRVARDGGAARGRARTCGSPARSRRTRRPTSSTAVLRCPRASPPSGRCACGTRNGEASAWSAPGDVRDGPARSSPTGARRSGSSSPGARPRSRCRSSPAASRSTSRVRSARLYMSGLGLFEAQINGAKLTDEVLAPGYSNYQLSAEYRTYDVTSRLRGGANTIGVELGQGTAHNVKMANPAAGADELVRVVEQLRGRQRHADRPGGRGRHQRQGLQRRQLLRRRHDQRRHRRRRRAARVAHDHLDRHRADAARRSRCRPRPGDTNVKVNSVAGMSRGRQAARSARQTHDDHLGRHRGGQHDAGGRLDDRRRAGTPPPVAAGRELDLERRRRTRPTPPAGTIYMRQDVQRRRSRRAITRAQLRVNGDDSHVTFVNGQQVAQSGTGNNAWQTSQIVDIKSRLVAGTNVIAIAAHQRRQLAAARSARSQLDDERIVTDTTWKALAGTPATPPAGWNTAGSTTRPGRPRSHAAPTASRRGTEHPGAGDAEPVEPQGRERHRLRRRRHDHDRHGRQPRRARSPPSAPPARTAPASPSASRSRSCTPTARPCATCPSPGTGVTFEPALGQAYAAGTAVTTPGTGITFTPALDGAHAAGVDRHRLGQPARRARRERRRAGHAAADRPPRDHLHRRHDRRRSSPTATGARRSAPSVTDHWFGGTDYDARREQAGWTAPGAT